MPKKACCCVPAGSYIAIPCRYAVANLFVGPTARYAHYDGSVENAFGDFGGGQGNLIGPFRFVNGVSVFDTTRKIRYMLRGAGGGAGGPQIKRNFPGFQQITPFQFSKGGNGAYTEFETFANQDHVIRGGAGGSGGINNWYVGDIADPNISKHKRQGGQGVYVDANGGDAAFISSGAQWSIEQPPLAAAGGGGGGAFFWNDRTSGSPSEQPDPQDTAAIGPRNGGNAGIEKASKGEDGWSNVSNGPTGGGGGASDTAPGCAGTRIIITSANIHPTNGTALLGGRGQRFRFEETNNVFTYIGRGGGGGGGLFGGGGGAFSGAGGGGSSTKGNTYSFVAKDDFPANHCNPYMDSRSGIGGRRTPLNPSANGTDGSVTQYYIKGFCPCDPSKDEMPEPLFICLNQVQYDYIITELGSTPTPPFNQNGEFDGLFVYEGEEYILLGQCETNCESVYKVELNATFENIRWEFRTFNPFGSIDSPPPCCSQILCTPICRVTGANCANCGCAENSELLSCCETEGKPDSYFGVYNGWIYSCTKSNQNWIVPGESAPTITTVCLSPSNQECDTEPQPCEITISEPPEKCFDPSCDNCKVTLNVSGDLTWFDYCFPNCVERQLTINETFSNMFPNSTEFVLKPLDSCTNNEFFTANYLVQVSVSFNRVADIEEPVLEIEFDCVPPNPNVSISPFQICDAKINIDSPGAYLSTIVEEFNRLLAGRVLVRDLSGGKFYVGCGAVFTRSESSVSNGRLKITYFALHPYFVACVNALVDATVTPCPSSTTVGYFESAGLLDGWNMTTLNLSPCPCLQLPDSTSQFICQYCGPNDYGAPCPTSVINVSGSILSI